MVRMWVPTEQTAAALAGLPGAEVDIFTGDGGQEPPGAGEVEFYVPSFFIRPPAYEVMTRMPALRVVQTLTAGIDVLLPHIPAGVTLCNARGAHDAGTAEWVVAAMLAVIREFPLFVTAKAEQRWAFQRTGSLAGRSILIVGYGSIGAAVERRLAGFEVTVRRVARRPREGVAGVAQLPELLPDADVVVLLPPVTQETIGMADAAFLASMKDGALLVNAGRGSLVVTEALCAELRSGRLAAALDVTDPEPLPPGHPLWSMPNVFLTPHVAGSTPASAERTLRLLREQAERFLSGQALHNVIAGPY